MMELYFSMKAISEIAGWIAIILLFIFWAVIIIINKRK